MKKIVIHKISISKKGEEKKFQVRFPSAFTKITAIEVGVKLHRGVISEEEEEEVVAPGQVGGLDGGGIGVGGGLYNPQPVGQIETVVKLPTRTKLLGRLSLQSLKKENEFYFSDVTYENSDSFDLDDTIAFHYPDKLVSRLSRHEFEKNGCRTSPKVIFGKYKDLVATESLLPLSYTLYLYFEIE